VRDLKQVIVMRTDLNMRKGKMIAQGAHASMKVFFDRKWVGSAYPVRDTSLQLFKPSHVSALGKEAMLIPLTTSMMAWVEGQFTKVCVQVSSEEELRGLVAKAQEAGLPVALIEDAGLTEFGGVKTVTCCAIGPAKSADIDLITGHLKLL